jgi:AAA15 family ATPase/GTPase
LQKKIIFVEKYQKVKIFAMIIDFSVSNFRSFKTTMAFSFRADASKSHSENVFEATLSNGEKLRLLKTAVIYGANASGKSNVVNAFRSFRDFIEKSPELKYGDAIPWYEPFLLDYANLQSPCCFKISFLLQNALQYDYEIQFNQHAILRERLDFYPQGNKNLLFERQKNDIKFGRKFKNQNFNKKVVQNRLFLSDYGNQGHEQLSEIYLYFRHFLEAGTTLNGGLLREWETIVLKKAFENKAFEQKITHLLQVSDIKIERIEILPENLFQNHALYQKVYYNLFENGQKIAQTDQISWQNQSQGTKLLFAIGGKMLMMLTGGGTLVIDELDSSLHTDLCAFLLDLFQRSESNPANAQLIFTTHDVPLLGNDRFRKDQIWFTEKDAFGATSLFSAQDFDDVRDGIPFDKWYLNGKFGGKPKIKSHQFIYGYTQKTA